MVAWAVWNCHNALKFGHLTLPVDNISLGARGRSFKSLQHLKGSHKGQTVKGLHEVKHYLNLFSYLKLNHNIGLSNDHASVKDKDEFDEHLGCAIKSFQKNFLLNVTGRIKSSTLYKMITPRGNTKVRTCSATGFQEWLKRTQFTFVEARQGSKSDIVLAQYFPPTMGKMHFDVDENWSIDKPNGDQIDMVSVATHEIGHILGLQHSTYVNVVMYPFLNFGMTKIELSHDDIDGMLALYGTL
ncbi:hypothetical protein ACB098_04G112100 [Castanea mollissima]